MKGPTLSLLSLSETSHRNVCTAGRKNKGGPSPPMAAHLFFHTVNSTLCSDNRAKVWHPIKPGTPLTAPKGSRLLERQANINIQKKIELLIGRPGSDKG